MPVPSVIPVCCNKTAFALMKRAVRESPSSDSLLFGAMALSFHFGCMTGRPEIDGMIQDIADAVRRRTRSRNKKATLAHLHDVLFDDLGFQGNDDDRYTMENNFLAHVLRTRRGLPTTLCLIYRLVAERLGLRAFGVNLPGFFLCGVKMDGSVSFVNPFSGGSIMSEAETEVFLRKSFGQDCEVDKDMFRPTNNALWLTRMAQNILIACQKKDRYLDVAAILEMEILLWPDESYLLRDLSLVLAHCGIPAPAAALLAQYIELAPDDPRTDNLRWILAALEDENRKRR